MRAGGRARRPIVPAAAAACVTGATALRGEGVIETDAISPATLEDAYLALTSEDGAEDDEAAGPGRRAA